MTRTYQEQLDHLNTMVTKLHEHKNIAIGRPRKPVNFNRWFNRAQELLDEADDEEVHTIQIEEENKLPDNPTEEDLFNCYIEILNRSAHLLADKKQFLRIDEFEASSDYYTCAGDKEYEMMANEFRARGEVIRLEPNEMAVMRLVLKDKDRNVKATDIARELSDDSEYVIEAPHIISDINSKIRESEEAPNPLTRICSEKLPSGKNASVWHLYLHDEPRPPKK